MCSRESGLFCAGYKPTHRLHSGFHTITIVFYSHRSYLRPSKGVALSLCRVFLRSDVAELMVVNVAVVFVARANVAVAL